MTWRRRSGVWVCWSSLESDEERKLFINHLAGTMFDVWHAARDKKPYVDPVTMEVAEAGLDALDDQG